ncbi:hypothetical protein [Parapedobacter soli]|uniref:hypothetical protein n=1 Tax=Parapedobacter soli TaxID=416955 RepID=UPI0021CA45C2|nr:hypothetical protein [Parapedobacter soli]
MKNLKSIITGILSSAVFFMAVQVTLANQKANDTFAHKENSSNKKSPSAANLLESDSLWFQVTSPNNDENDHENQTVQQQPTETSPSGDCAPPNSGNVCSVQLDISGITDPIAYNALLARISTTSNKPTVEEFIDLGATYLEAAKQRMSGDPE